MCNNEGAHLRSVERQSSHDNEMLVRSTEFQRDANIGRPVQKLEPI